MNELDRRQNEIIEEFARLEGWEAKYSHVIELGKKLQAIDEKYQKEEYRVRGCQSVVWMFAEMTDEGRLQMFADAEPEAKIVRGLISLLLRVYNFASLDEVISTPPTFIEKLDLANHLSPSRANGLNSMVKQIKFYALALKAKSQR